MIKRVLIAIILILYAGLFLAFSLSFKQPEPIEVVEIEEVEQVSRTELLTEYLTDQLEITVATGKVSFQQIISDDSIIPFADKSLEIYMLYEYDISYILANCEVTTIGDRIYISLVNRFEYNVPTLIEERYTLDKTLLSGHFEPSIYLSILNTSRESVLETVKEQPINQYKKSVEQNLNILASKFGIENIKYIWKAAE